MNPKRLNLYELQFKAQNIIKRYADYRVEWAGFSLNDAKKYFPLSKT